MNPEAGFDLALYARVLQRRGPLLYIPLVILTAVLGVGSLLLPNVYGVEANVVVRQEADTAEGLAVKTQITQQLGGVIQELRQPSVQRMIFEKVRRAKPGLTLEDALLSWQTGLKIDSTPKEKDLIVSFGYKDGPAAYAVAVVNAFAEEFTRRGNQLVSGSLDSSVEFVGQELETQRKRLADLEEQQARIEKRLSGDLGDVASAAGEDMAKTIGSRLSDSQTKLDALDVTIASQQAQASYLHTQLAQTPASIEGRSSEGGGETPVGTLSRMLMEAKSRKVQLLSRYTASHPEVQAASEQIRDLETRLAQAKRSPDNSVATNAPNPAHEALRRDLVTLEGQLRANQAQRAALAGGSERLRRVQTSLPATQRELVRISAEAKAVRTTYEGLLQRRQNLDLNKNFEEGRNVSRFDSRLASMVPPPLKVWPKRSKYLLLGMLGGLVIGLGFVLLAEYLDHAVRSTSDLRRWVDAPVLAVLPRAPR